MDSLSVEIGRLCLSKLGRDKGRYFIIKEIIDSNYVYVVDGVLRKISSPKKKKLKHLELKPVVKDTIAIKFIEGKKVFDSEVRSAIYSTEYMSNARERRS